MAEVVEAPPSGPVRRGLLAPGGAIPIEGGEQGEAGIQGARSPRWAGSLGFSWDPVNCIAADPLPIVCPTDASKPDGEDSLAALQEHVAVALFGVDRCSAMGRGEDGRVDRARQNLLDTQSHQMEREFWDGVASRAADPDLPNLYLTKRADGATVATVLDATAVAYRSALAELEQGLAECLHGQQGMILATPYTTSLWFTDGALRVEGQRLLTAMDTIVVPGSGFSGSAPATTDGGAPVAPTDLTAAGYAYGTGLVYSRLGNINNVGTKPAEWLNRATNDWVTRVERPAAAVTAGCCVLAINVDHTTA